VPTVFTLPWRWSQAERPKEVVLFASRFDAVGLRARWVLFIAGIRLRHAVLHSPGALGVSLCAHPIAGRYYTLSMWEDEVSLVAFAHSETHRAAARATTELGPVHGVLISREADNRRPRWRETRRWISTAKPGPYRNESVVV
jgi:hypothetical protein